MSLRLGLDIGTNSIGWALLRLDENGDPLGLIDGGVRIYPDGRNPKDKSSNARKRREKRGPRRNRDRRLARRRRLRERLIATGLLPEDDAARAAAFRADPYRLRAKALDGPLPPAPLGRALWALNAGRGFKSNRKTDKAEDKGALKADISELRRRIAQSGSRTLGEYLWRRHKSGKEVRARLGNGLYRDREMVREEFDAIRRVQAAHHDLAPEDWDELADIIFHQRPLRSPPVGKCTLIPSEPRAMKALPVFQRYRILSDLVNLEVAPPLEGFRSLNKDELDKLYLKLLSQTSLDFRKIPSLLGLPERTRINLETTNRTKILGDQTAVVLAAGKRFGKGWRALPVSRQTEVVERLLEAEDESALTDWLRQAFGLSPESAEAVAAAPLPTGTAAYSVAALERLIEPMLEQGLRQADAVREAGLEQISNSRMDDRLPYYGAVLRRHVLGEKENPRNDVERFGRIGNPTVHIGLNEVRRVVNEVIGTHGKPDELVIELARDLKQTAEARLDTQRRQKINTDRNERLKDELKKAGIPFSPHLLRKLKLWEDQGKPGERVCPFTGTPLSFELVISEETEIEHILPFSRTLDDRNANKVLSMRSANREKGNRTPFEAWGADAGAYVKILARAEAMPAKAWRFQPDAMTKFEEQSDFIGRQLNETRYLSRLTKEYLGCVADAKRIWVIPGEMTALLRGKWGLNGILADANKKDRTDHRHHMIDAIVIALSSRGMMQRIAKAAGQSGERLIEDMPEPWENYYAEIREKVLGATVSFKPDHGTPGLNGTTSGSLHNDTALGPVEGPDEKGIHTLVVRKPLAELKPADLEQVRDPHLRGTLETLFHEAAGAGGTDKEIWQRFLNSAQRRLGTRRVRLLQREGNLVFVRDKAGKPYKAYKADGNAWMDVWLLPDGKVRGETVTRFSANQKSYRSALKDSHPTARKLMRLHINDMVAVGEGAERRLLRVQKLSGQKITMVDHNEGGDLRKRETSKDPEVRYEPLRRSAGRVLSEGIRKVTVTPAGRILDGGPFGPDGRRRSRSWNAGSST